MKTFYFLALAVMAIAEPSPEEIAAINNAEEPQSAKGHKIDKREAMPGYGPKIDVDMEINAGQRARVNIDIDVNIDQEEGQDRGQGGGGSPEGDGGNNYENEETTTYMFFDEWGPEGWWDDAVVAENYNPPGYKYYPWPYANSHCPPRSDLSGQTPCNFDCVNDYDCPKMKLCCSNDCGRVCVVPEMIGTTRCGCSITFFSDLDEYVSPSPDIAKVAHFVWNVLQGSLSPSLQPHLFFTSLYNRDWLGNHVQDDCLLELKLQSFNKRYSEYDPFEMDYNIMFAIITDSNSTFMREYVDYFGDIFTLIAIRVGDVDPDAKLDAVAFNVIEADSLDNLTEAVEEVKSIFKDSCSCDDVTENSCLEAGDPCDGECNRLNFVCEDGTCQRVVPETVSVTYKSYFGDYEDEYYYYDFYDYYEYYDYDYMKAGEPNGKPGRDPNRPHKDGTIFPPVLEKKNSSKKGKPDEGTGEKASAVPSPCTKSLYPKCNGYLSQEDKENCMKHKPKDNCKEPEQGSKNRKLAVLDEGPKRYLYRTIDYTGNCPAGLFRCSGIPTVCLYGELLCNGEKNCLFGDDEDDAFCSNRECLVTEFRCDSGQCIKRSQECDGTTNCWDGTDEHCANNSDCPTPRTHYCGAGGACINPTFICDNILDCPNGEDEVPCNCTDFKCSSGECINNYFMCNGRKDCKDGSDESAEECADFVCQESHFKCGSGQCIPHYQVCDCRQNCADGSDERNCTETPMHYKWRCNNGQCIYEWNVCDGYTNCEDGSDENNCTDSTYCSGFTCDSGQCISSYSRCNMITDCADGSDENCSNHTCPSYRFQCGTGHCIYKYDVCNGRENCPDGSDEMNCSSETCNGYLCTTGECVQGYQLCDGVYHCHDRKDESVCPAIPCPSYRFHKCDSGECIDSYHNLSCNGYRDCRDGSDEMNCEDIDCPANKPFRCGTGECIESYRVCNNFNDCMDKIDEIGCGCRYYQVTCDSGHCVSTDSRCNGIWDCLGGNDESQCNNFTCPYERPFKCRSEVCLSGNSYCNEKADCPGDVHEVCLSRECDLYEYRCASGECVSGNVCDGRAHCGDRSDETNCQDFVCPSNRPFKCRSGECIWESQVCNGYPNCKDASDETFCSNETCPRERNFYCTSGECINKRNVCDGYENCRDGSDETAGCEIFCPDNFNICNDNKCFPPNWICDSMRDCPNGEDEEDCDNFVRQCDLHQFKCTYENECISSDFVCDTYYDCTDGEDEQNCTTSTTTASP